MEGRPQDVEEWLHKWSPAQQEQARNLAAAVHGADEAVVEAIKWRRLTFTVDDNWHHWLCAITVTKRGVSLMFHKGSLLDDPVGLLRGDGSYLRHIPPDQIAEHPDAVTALVRQAIEHQTDMLDDEA